MIELLCVIGVIYVTVDLLGSAYLVRRFGGFRATWRQVKANIRSDWRTTDGDECTCYSGSCECDDC